MAYSRPTYKRRAPARKYQTKSVYKKSVKAPRAAIATLDYKVRKVVNQMRGMASTIQYAQGGVSAIGNVGGTNVYIQGLSQYGTAQTGNTLWNRVFGTDADDESNHSAIWKKTNIDCEIDTDGEQNNIDYTMFIVSLTKLGASELFTPSTGGLAGPLGITSLTDGTHFQVNGSYGIAMLNRKYFNIKYVKRIITGTKNALAYETSSLRKRMYIKLNHGTKGSGFKLQNPKGDWRAQPSTKVAGQNLYVLIFNNDSTLDASVKFKFNAIHTVDVA